MQATGFVLPGFPSMGSWISYGLGSMNSDLPTFVVLAVAETTMAVRGDTATNITKPATLETGGVITVPGFINEGDTIKIDTRTSTYIERVNK